MKEPYVNLIDENLSTSHSFIIGYSYEAECKDYDIEMNMSYQMSPDISSCHDDILSNNIEIDIKGVIILFFLSMLFLPFYVIALVVDIRKTFPHILSRFKAFSLFILSIIFMIAFWMTIGLWSHNYNDWKSIISPTEITFIIAIYIICCCAESVLKSSFFIKDRDYINFRHHLNTLSENDHKIGQIINQIQQQTISKNIKTFVQFFNIFIAIVHGITSESLRWFPNPNVDHKSQLIWFSITCCIVKINICYFIFHYLGETIIQLHDRFKQLKYFTSLTSSHQSAKFDLPFMKLNNLSSIKNWQLIRATLLYEYQQPKLFIDIILSSSFVILFTSLILSGYHLFSYNKLDHIINFIIIFSLIIFIYIMIALILAINVMDGYNQTGILSVAHLRHIYSDNYDKKTTLLLQTLQKVITDNSNEAIIFRILGIGITKPLTTIFFTLGLSAISSISSEILKH